MRRPQRLGRFGTTAVTATAVALCVTSVAWACTAIMGPIRICSPTSGTCEDTDTGEQGRAPAGSTVTVTGRGLKVKPATYALYFGDGFTDCHSATTILTNPAGKPLTKMTTDKQGRLDRKLSQAGVQPYKAVIPADAAIGEHDMCTRETYPKPENSASVHAMFTVLGA